MLQRLLWPALAFISLAAPPERGFTSLFNGHDLTGWQIVHQQGPGYVVENGILKCPSDGGGNLFTKDQYANFIFRFEFKLEEGSNNGVGIRAPLEGDSAFQGMEIQILDHDAPIYRGKLKPAQYHGSIYDVVPAKTEFLKPRGEWNSEEIHADGPHIKITLNGHAIVDANLDTVTDPETLKRHPGIKRAGGYLGFLGHGPAQVWFRNIRIKVLP